MACFRIPRLPEVSVLDGLGALGSYRTQLHARGPADFFLSSEPWFHPDLVAPAVSLVFLGISASLLPAVEGRLRLAVVYTFWALATPGGPPSCIPASRGPWHCTVAGCTICACT